MKKLFSIIMLIVLTFSLSGCTVNWFGESYDVPWFVIAVPVAVICVIGHVYIMSGTYVCPECGEIFKPKWYQISAYVHFMSERLIKCPKCKKINYCRRKK